MRGDGCGGRGHDEGGRVAAGSCVRGAGDVDELGKPRAGRRVHAVTDTSGELRHLRAEPGDDDRRRGLRAQEARRAAGRARPHRTDALDRRFDGVPPFARTRHRATERVLFGRVRRVRAASRADPQHQPPAADLLQGGRHHRERARIAIGDVEHERAHGDAGHGRRDRGERRPTLDDPSRAVHRPGEVVVEPETVEAGLLGRDRAVPQVVPRPAERVESTSTSTMERYRPLPPYCSDERSDREPGIPASSEAFAGPSGPAREERGAESGR